ncbi:UEV domain-containing protein [Terfezia claveryi]|nr:UEV domain-containing protein [Terfezia claveryi]
MSATANPNDRITPQLLQWLHTVIAPAYIDPRRTYGDVVQALRNIPSLSPRTDVYTHETGHPELLLLLHGTLPANFRGATYNIPIHLWIPQRYPHQAPMAFVVPHKDMLIRPGNHVDGNGRCYHPYLTGWGEYFDKSNLVDLCDVLKGVFGREPPVYARGPAQQRPQPQQTPTPPPIHLSPPMPGGILVHPPSLPRELAPLTPLQPQQRGPPVPPPPPPKPGKEGSQERGNSRSNSLPGVGGVSTPPPLPPAPHRQQQQPQPQYVASPVPPPVPGRPAPVPYGTPYTQPPPPPHYGSPRTGPLHYPASTPPAPPPPPPLHMRYPAARGVGGGGPPLPPMPTTSQQGQPPFAGPSSSPFPTLYIPSPLNPSPLPNSAIPPSYQHRSPPPPPQQSQPPPLPQPPNKSRTQPPKPKKQIPDLLSNPVTDLLLSLPSSSISNANTPPPPPPPLPPNPQKDHVIHSISLALHDLALQSSQKTQAALEQAASQRDALLRTEQKMLQEQNELQKIEAVAEMDIGIFRERISMAENLIHEVGNGGGEDGGKWSVPDADKLVVASTVVHGQLYDLVTEEMAVEEAIFVLGRALDKERVGLDVFLKHMRTLAREQFIIRATIKKIVGMIRLEEGEGRKGGRE